MKSVKKLESVKNELISQKVNFIKKSLVIGGQLGSAILRIGDRDTVLK